MSPIKNLLEKYIITLLFGFFLSGMIGGLSPAEGKLQVVTTTSDLQSITEFIGGDRVAAASITAGYQDPHFVDPKPSYMITARNADLFIRIGMELELGWESLILEGSRNPRIRVGSPGHLDASVGITPLEVPTQRVSRSMGDVHPLGNPHYWLDPYNGRIIAGNISNRLKQLDPANAADYDRNLAAFLLELDNAMFGEKLVTAIGGERLWQLQMSGGFDKVLSSNADGQTLSLDGWLAKLKPFEGSKIAAYHRSWPYFAHRFGLDVVVELEPKPGIPPSAGHLKTVIEEAKRNDIKIILMEVFYSEKPARFVAGLTNARVVIVPNSVGGTKQARDYLTLIDVIVQNVVEGLKE